MYKKYNQQYVTDEKQKQNCPSFSVSHRAHTHTHTHTHTHMGDTQKHISVHVNTINNI